MVGIAVNPGAITIIDDEDLPAIAGYKWQLDTKGYVTRRRGKPAERHPAAEGRVGEREMTELEHRTAAQVCRVKRQDLTAEIRNFPNPDALGITEHTWNRRLDTLGLMADEWQRREAKHRQSVQEWALREIEHTQAARRDQSGVC